MAGIYDLLKLMIDRGASDLHISSSSPPLMRLNGKLVSMDNTPLTPSQTKSYCYSLLTDSQKHKFEENKEIDLSFGVKGVSRFRANIFFQKGTVAGAFRTIPYEIRSLKDLGLPPIIRELTRKPRGLILVTGPTGSGKSTTLATIIDSINAERQEHIITIEDPIEFLHQNKSCLVNQREINADTDSFKKALKYILRQDPDVVLVGEMRDLETIEAALTIAETGHLTFATLHTNSAAQTINRIIDVFPSYQQEQIRVQLSFVLEGILSQQLIATKTGRARLLAIEVLVPTAAIRNLIREDKVHQLYSSMQSGQAKFGMQTMNQSLFDLYSHGKLSQEDTLARSSKQDELITMIEKHKALRAKRRR